MDHRALFLASLGLVTPSLSASTAHAEDPAPRVEPTPPPAHTPEEYARCGMLRSMPDWCRDRPADPRRVRVRPRDEQGR